MDPNHKVGLTLVLLVASLSSLPCLGLCLETNGIVESVHFQTRALPPIFRVPASQRQYEPLFRTGLQALPEGALVTTAILAGGQGLGLSTNEAQSLGPLLAETYQQICTDPVLKDVPSALTFCFSTNRHTNGHYFLYRPKELPENPASIVFLHGYGGNFLFYTWAMNEAFPDAVIIVASWSASWYDGSLRYIEDAVRDAGQRLGKDLRQPLLVGISAGGRVGFRLYNQRPSMFQGFVCLASAPEDTVARALRKESRILMINGTRDTMASIQQVRALANLAKRRAPQLQLEELDADHFFILSRRTEMAELINKFLGGLDDKARTLR